MSLLTRLFPFMNTALPAPSLLYPKPSTPPHIYGASKACAARTRALKLKHQRSTH